MCSSRKMLPTSLNCWIEPWELLDWCGPFLFTATAAGKWRVLVLMNSNGQSLLVSAGETQANLSWMQFLESTLFNLFFCEKCSKMFIAFFSELNWKTALQCLRKMCFTVTLSSKKRKESLWAPAASCSIFSDWPGTTPALTIIITIIIIKKKNPLPI